MTNNNSNPNSDNRQLVPIGLDAIASLITSGEIRIGDLNGVKVGSLVDVVSHFVDTNRPRKWWNDHKSRVIGNTDELSAEIGQLKLIAEDGKMRATDVAPLWAILWVILRMDTPAANAFSKSYLKIHADEDVSIIKYRLTNIANGSERSADGIHQELLRSGLLHTDPNDDVWRDDTWKRS